MEGIVRFCAVYFVVSCFLPKQTGANSTQFSDGNSKSVYEIDKSSRCLLFPLDEHLSEKIAVLEEEGDVLLNYALSIKGYDINPLLVDIDYGYKGDRWNRVFNTHGEVLLTLTFNYDILSLNLLQFGVNSLDIELKDEPAGCLGTLGEKQKIVQVLKLLRRDFKSENETSRVLDGKNYACYQQIHVMEKKKEVEFVHECCQHHEHSNFYICKEVERIKTITFLYCVIFSIKFLFFLFGPSLVMGWLYHEPVKTLTYVVPQIVQGKIEISVDHNLLISEKRVSVGLIRFLVDNFLKCKITKKDPFHECCSQSILGSWKCLPQKRSENAKVVAWEDLFLFLGSHMSLALVSLPFIIRIVLYYEFEEDEIVSRREAVSERGYDLADAHNIFQKLSPTSGFLIIVYLCYFVSFVALAMLRRCYRDKLEAIVFPALEDMREISYTEGLKMFFKYVVFPFTKFGLLGFVVAPIYWCLILPFCIIVLLCYGLPILYLTGRFLIHKRPSLLQSVQKRWEEAIAVDEKEPLDSNDSNPGEDSPPTPPQRTTCTKLIQRAFPFVVGMIYIINMNALVAMYAEIVGYVAEIIFLTFMGAIINAGLALQYIMLLFWTLLYTTQCFNNVYVAYMKLNQKLFKFMKKKLSDKVKDATRQHAKNQKNTAFKYLTEDEIDELREKYPALQAEEKREDTLVETKKGVFWDIRSLVLFVDKNDVPRISRKLFFEICEEELGGYPGPVYKRLAIATKQLVYMVLFLVFVFLVILSFGYVYKLSSTNKILLTLAGGFLPTVIRFVMLPRIKIDVDMNTFAFEGKMEELLFKFSEKWPRVGENPNPQSDVHDGGHSSDHENPAQETF